MSTEKIVLVVEDDPDIQSFVEILLSGEGYQVELASNGQQALSRIRAAKPAVVLLDLTLPGMSGPELAHEVRQQFGAGIPIVIMSAGTNLDATAREIGADDSIAKPFEVDDLIQVVKKWVP